MRCKSAMEMLPGYMADQLPAEQAEELRSHLESCKRCPRVTKIGGTWMLEEKLAPRPRRVVATHRLSPPPEDAAESSSLLRA